MTHVLFGLFEIALSNGKLLLLTIAANMPGAVELIKVAVAAGIKVSLGHQMATADDLNKCADAGASMLTHLGNGMPNLVHRHNNPLFHGLANDALMACLITDGFHLPPDVIKVKLPSPSLQSC